MFPIDPKIFGCTCFVRDVRPQVFKLDPKSLKCFFVGYFVSTDVAFFETTPFSFSSTVTSQGEEEDLLVYTLASPIVSSEPTLVPV